MHANFQQLHHNGLIFLSFQSKHVHVLQLYGQQTSLSDKNWHMM